MKVLFVCRSNAGRSQMAEGFFRKYSKKNSAWSGAVDVGTGKTGGAGLPPGPGVIIAMRRFGIDISKRKRKQATRDMLKKSDRIIILMTEHESEKYLTASFRAFPEKTVLWQIQDMRYVKNPDLLYKRALVVKKCVQKLVKEIG